MGAIETHRLFFLTSRAIQPEAGLISNQFLPKTAGTSNRDLLEGAGLIIMYLPYSCRTLILIHQSPVFVWLWKLFLDFSELIYLWSKTYGAIQYSWYTFRALTMHAQHTFYSCCTCLEAYQPVCSALHCVSASTGHKSSQNTHPNCVRQEARGCSLRGRALHGHCHLGCPIRDTFGASYSAGGSFT